MAGGSPTHLPGNQQGCRSPRES
ncbi:hypothetical protein LINPERPRIM_LOCUS2735 [Linum perenne]